MSDKEKEHKKKSHSSHGGHGGGSHEEHEGAPEWLISFADNVTLMMGFFVILLAMNLKPAATGASNAPAQGQEEPSANILDAAIAIREAFHNPVDLGSSDPKDMPLIRRILAREGESDANQKGQKGREHDVRSIRPGKHYTLGGAVEFEEGQSEPSPELRKAVAEFAGEMAGHRLIVEVRGHVSAAEAFDRPDRGMQLSFSRAQEVAKILGENGLSWSQIRIFAYGDTDRLVLRAYDKSAHRTNQRVEVMVTDRVMQASAESEEDPKATPEPQP